MYYPVSSIAQYDIDFGDKDKGILLTSIIQLPNVKNHFQIKEIERRERYKSFKTDDLIITTWNSVRWIHTRAIPEKYGETLVSWKETVTIFTVILLAISGSFILHVKNRQSKQQRLKKKNYEQWPKHQKMKM